MQWSWPLTHSGIRIHVTQLAVLACSSFDLVITDLSPYFSFNYLNVLLYLLNSLVEIHLDLK